MIINSILPTNRYVKRNICISHDCRYKIIERFNGNICVVDNESEKSKEYKVCSSKTNFDKDIKDIILYSLGNGLKYNRMTHDIIKDSVIFKGGKDFVMYYHRNSFNIAIPNNKCNSFSSIPVIPVQGHYGGVSKIYGANSYNFFQFEDIVIITNVNNTSKKIKIISYPRFEFTCIGYNGDETIVVKDIGNIPCDENLIDKINEKIKPNISCIFDF